LRCRAGKQSKPLKPYKNIKNYQIEILAKFRGKQFDLFGLTEQSELSLSAVHTVCAKQTMVLLKNVTKIYRTSATFVQ